MADDNHPNPSASNRALALGIALGAGMGAALGAALNDVGVWLPIGIGVGTSLGIIFSRRGPLDRTSQEPRTK